MSEPILIYWTMITMQLAETQTKEKNMLSVLYVQQRQQKQYEIGLSEMRYRKMAEGPVMRA